MLLVGQNRQKSGSRRDFSPPEFTKIVHVSSDAVSVGPQSAAAPQAAGETEEIQKGPSVNVIHTGSFRLEVEFDDPTEDQLALNPDHLGTTTVSWNPVGGGVITANHTIQDNARYVLQYRTDGGEWTNVPATANATWYNGNTEIEGAGTTRLANNVTFNTLDYSTYDLRLSVVTTQTVQIEKATVEAINNYTGLVEMNVTIDGTNGSEAIENMFRKGMYAAGQSSMLTTDQMRNSYSHETANQAPESIFYIQYKAHDWKDGDDLLEARIFFNASPGVAMPDPDDETGFALGEAYARWGLFGDGEGKMETWTIRMFLDYEGVTGFNFTNPQLEYVGIREEVRVVMQHTATASSGITQDSKFLVTMKNTIGHNSTTPAPGGVKDPNVIYTLPTIGSPGEETWIQPKYQVGYIVDPPNGEEFTVWLDFPTLTDNTGVTGDVSGGPHLRATWNMESTVQGEHHWVFEFDVDTPPVPIPAGSDLIFAGIREIVSIPVLDATDGETIIGAETSEDSGARLTITVPQNYFNANGSGPSAEQRTGWLIGWTWIGNTSEIVYSALGSADIIYSPTAHSGAPGWTITLDMPGESFGDSAGDVVFSHITRVVTPVVTPAEIEDITTSFSIEEGTFTVKIEETTGTTAGSAGHVSATQLFGVNVVTGGTNNAGRAAAEAGAMHLVGLNIAGRPIQFSVAALRNDGNDENVATSQGVTAFWTAGSSGGPGFWTIEIDVDEIATGGLDITGLNLASSVTYQGITTLTTTGAPTGGSAPTITGGAHFVDVVVPVGQGIHLSRDYELVYTISATGGTAATGFGTFVGRPIDGTDGLRYNANTGEWIVRINHSLSAPLSAEATPAPILPNVGAAGFAVNLVEIVDLAKPTGSSASTPPYYSHPLVFTGSAGEFVAVSVEHSSNVNTEEAAGYVEVVFPENFGATLFTNDGLQQLGIVIEGTLYWVDVVSAADHDDLLPNQMTAVLDTDVWTLRIPTSTVPAADGEPAAIGGTDATPLQDALFNLVNVPNGANTDFQSSVTVFALREHFAVPADALEEDTVLAADNEAEFALPMAFANQNYFNGGKFIIGYIDDGIEKWVDFSYTGPGAMAVWAAGTGWAITVDVEADDDEEIEFLGIMRVATLAAELAPGAATEVGAEIDDEKATFTILGAQLGAGALNNGTHMIGVTYEIEDDETATIWVQLVVGKNAIWDAGDSEWNITLDLPDGIDADSADNAFIIGIQRVPGVEQTIAASAVTNGNEVAFNISGVQWNAAPITAANLSTWVAAGGMVELDANGYTIFIPASDFSIANVGTPPAGTLTTNLNPSLIGQFGADIFGATVTRFIATAGGPYTTHASFEIEDVKVEFEIEGSHDWLDEIGGANQQVQIGYRTGGIDCWVALAKGTNATFAEGSPNTVGIWTIAHTALQDGGTFEFLGYRVIDKATTFTTGPAGQESTTMGTDTTFDVTIAVRANTGDDPIRDAIEGFGEDYKVGEPFGLAVQFTDNDTSETFYSKLIVVTTLPDADKMEPGTAYALWVPGESPIPNGNGKWTVMFGAPGVVDVVLDGIVNVSNFVGSNEPMVPTSITHIVNEKGTLFSRVEITLSADVTQSALHTAVGYPGYDANRPGGALRMPVIEYRIDGTLYQIPLDVAPSSGDQNAFWSDQHEGQPEGFGTPSRWTVMFEGEGSLYAAANFEFLGIRDTMILTEDTQLGLKGHDAGKFVSDFSDPIEGELYLEWTGSTPTAGATYQVSWPGQSWLNVITTGTATPGVSILAKREGDRWIIEDFKSATLLDDGEAIDSKDVEVRRTDTVTVISDEMSVNTSPPIDGPIWVKAEFIKEGEGEDAKDTKDIEVTWMMDDAAWQNTSGFRIEWSQAPSFYSGDSPFTFSEEQPRGALENLSTNGSRFVIEGVSDGTWYVRVTALPFNSDVRTQSVPVEAEGGPLSTFTLDAVEITDIKVEQGKKPTGSAPQYDTWDEGKWTLTFDVSAVAGITDNDTDVDYTFWISATPNFADAFEFVGTVDPDVVDGKREVTIEIPGASNVNSAAAFGQSGLGYFGPGEFYIFAQAFNNKEVEYGDDKIEAEKDTLRSPIPTAWIGTGTNANDGKGVLKVEIEPTVDIGQPVLESATIVQRLSGAGAGNWDVTIKLNERVETVRSYLVHISTSSDWNARDEEGNLLRRTAGKDITGALGAGNYTGNVESDGVTAIWTAAADQFEPGVEYFVWVQVSSAAENNRDGWSSGIRSLVSDLDNPVSFTTDYLLGNDAVVINGITTQQRIPTVSSNATVNNNLSTFTPMGKSEVTVTIAAPIPNATYYKLWYRPAVNSDPNFVDDPEASLAERGFVSCDALGVTANGSATACGIASGQNLTTLTFYNIDLEMSVEYEFIIAVRGDENYVTAPDSEIFTLEATAGTGAEYGLMGDLTLSFSASGGTVPANGTSFYANNTTFVQNTTTGLWTVELRVGSSLGQQAYNNELMSYLNWSYTDPATGEVVVSQPRLLDAGLGLATASDLNLPSGVDVTFWVTSYHLGDLWVEWTNSDVKETLTVGGNEVVFTQVTIVPPPANPMSPPENVLRLANITYHGNKMHVEEANFNGTERNIMFTPPVVTFAPSAGVDITVPFYYASPPIIETNENAANPFTVTLDTDRSSPTKGKYVITTNVNVQPVGTNAVGGFADQVSPTRYTLFASTTENFADAEGVDTSNITRSPDSEPNLKFVAALEQGETYYFWVVAVGPGSDAVYSPPGEWVAPVVDTWVDATIDDDGEPVPGYWTIGGEEDASKPGNYTAATSHTLRYELSTPTLSEITVSQPGYLSGNDNFRIDLRLDGHSVLVDADGNPAGVLPDGHVVGYNVWYTTTGGSEADFADAEMRFVPVSNQSSLVLSLNDASPLESGKQIYVWMQAITAVTNATVSSGPELSDITQVMSVTIPFALQEFNDRFADEIVAYEFVPADEEDEDAVGTWDIEIDLGSAVAGAFAYYVWFTTDPDDRDFDKNWPHTVIPAQGANKITLDGVEIPGATEEGSPFYMHVQAVGWYTTGSGANQRTLEDWDILSDVQTVSLNDKLIPPAIFVLNAEPQEDEISEFLSKSSTSVTLDWAKVTGAGDYQIQVRTWDPNSGEDGDWSEEPIDLEDAGIEWKWEYDADGRAAGIVSGLSPDTDYQFTLTVTSPVVDVEPVESENAVSVKTAEPQEEVTIGANNFVFTGWYEGTTASVTISLATGTNAIPAAVLAQLGSITLTYGEDAEGEPYEVTLSGPNWTATVTGAGIVAGEEVVFTMETPEAGEIPISVSNPVGTVTPRAIRVVDAEAVIAAIEIDPVTQNSEVVSATFSLGDFELPEGVTSIVIVGGGGTVTLNAGNEWSGTITMNTLEPGATPTFTVEVNLEATGARFEDGQDGTGEITSPALRLDNTIVIPNSAFTPYWYSAGGDSVTISFNPNTPGIAFFGANVPSFTVAHGENTQDLNEGNNWTVTFTGLAASEQTLSITANVTGGNEFVTFNAPDIANIVGTPQAYTNISVNAESITVTGHRSDAGDRVTFTLAEGLRADIASVVISVGDRTVTLSESTGGWTQEMTGLTLGANNVTYVFTAASHATIEDGTPANESGNSRTVTTTVTTLDRIPANVPSDVTITADGDSEQGGTVVFSVTNTAALTNIATITIASGEFTVTLTADGGWTGSISGLTNGTAYTFTVTTAPANTEEYRAGTGPAITVTPQEVSEITIGQPQNVTATLQGNAITVTWNAPAVNAEHVGHYLVELRPTGGGAIIGVTVPAHQFSHVFEQVVQGSYRISVTAMVGPAAGTGPDAGGNVPVNPSDPAYATDGQGNEIVFEVGAATTPLTPPTNVHVPDGGVSQSTMNVTWTAGGPAGAVAGYTVRYSADGGETWRQATTTGTNVVLTGLMPGTAYQIYVVADPQNAEAYSAASSPTITIATYAMPVTVAPGTEDGQLVVTWPQVDGAVSYNVTYSESPYFVGGSTKTISGSIVRTATTGTTTGATALETVINGLTPGQTYYVQVVAVFAGGVESDPNASVDGATAKAQTLVPPTNVNTTPTGTNSFNVTWTTPVGASGITCYVVTYQFVGTDGGLGTPFSIHTGLVNSFTLSGLNPGAYLISVKAVGAAGAESAAVFAEGAGPEAGIQTGTTAATGTGVAVRPQAATAVSNAARPLAIPPTHNSVTLTWRTDNVANIGSNATYVINAVQAGSSAAAQRAFTAAQAALANPENLVWHTQNGQIVGVTINGLTAGLTYRFTVAGANADGAGASAAATVNAKTLTPQQVNALRPAVVKGSQTINSAQVRWAMPTSGIDGYSIQILGRALGDNGRWVNNVVLATLRIEIGDLNAPVIKDVIVHDRLQVFNAANGLITSSTAAGPNLNGAVNPLDADALRQSEIFVGFTVGTGNNARPGMAVTLNGLQAGMTYTTQIYATDSSNVAANNTAGTFKHATNNRDQFARVSVKTTAYVAPAMRASGMSVTVTPQTAQNRLPIIATNNGSSGRDITAAAVRATTYATHYEISVYSGNQSAAKIATETAGTPLPVTVSGTAINVNVAGAPTLATTSVATNQPQTFTVSGVSGQHTVAVWAVTTVTFADGTTQEVRSVVGRAIVR
ncbi:MAG: fibronectin type III domain-containing protein [Planctomycetaceae bacterium]|nr:fibronectin type III domain-containing protein [Planctomycetaceae bacterium]